MKSKTAGSSEREAEQDSEEDYEYEYELCTDAWRQFANRPYFKRVRKQRREIVEDQAEAGTSGQSSSMRINMHSVGSAPPTDSQIIPALEWQESVGISRNQSESVGIRRARLAKITLLLLSHGYRISGGEQDLFIKTDSAGYDQVQTARRRRCRMVEFTHAPQRAVQRHAGGMAQLEVGWRQGWPNGFLNQSRTQKHPANGW